MSIRICAVSIDSSREHGSDQDTSDPVREPLEDEAQRERRAYSSNGAINSFHVLTQLGGAVYVLHAFQKKAKRVERYCISLQLYANITPVVAISFLVSAVIFDLDGVLVDSREVVDRAWLEWGTRHGLDAEVVRRSIPGRRTRDAVALLVPTADADREAATIIARESALVDSVRSVPGAREAVASVAGARWAIATSGTDAIARGRLRVAGFPLPDVFVTAELVARGKPDPEAYLLAAAGLEVEPAACVVFEDAVSGVAAATAAGCTVVGVRTSAMAGMLGAPYAVIDLRAVDLRPVDGRIRVTLEPVA